MNVDSSAVFGFGDVLSFTSVDDLVARIRAWNARRAVPRLAKDLPIGERAKVIGTVQTITPVVSPFTKTECAFWSVVVAIKTMSVDVAGSGPSVNVGWKVDLSARSSEPFFIVDDAGEHVVFDPADAIIALKGALVNDHPSVNDENAELGAFLRSHGMVQTMYMGLAGDHRFYEALVLPSQRLSVWGWVSEDTEQAAQPQHGGGYRESVQRSMKRISGRPNYRAALMLP